MKLQLVSFEQAKALKELGFYGYSSNERELYVTSNEITWEQAIETYGDGYDYITHHETFPVNVVGELLRDVRDKNICFATNFQTVYAPTLELAAKWLREEKKIYIDVTWGNMQGNIIWCASLNNLGKGSSMLGDIKHVDSYEEALSAGIDKAIEMLKGI